MPPQPPVIITTDLDSAERGAVPEHDTAAGPPVGSTHSTPPRQDYAHLSPHRQNGMTNAGLSPIRTPPSPTLTTSSSVHFSDETYTPSSPTPNKSSMALRDNHPSADGGRDTLKVIGANDPVRHSRGWSIGTFSSATEVGDNDKEHQGHQKQTVGGKVKEDEIDEKTGGVLSKKDKKKKKGEKEVISSALNPENDHTDPTPFREKPSKLAMLVDPKSLEDLEKIGGTTALLEGLGVDRKKGLLGDDGSAPRGSGDIVGSGAQWKATLEQRRKVYGRNELPQKPTKSLLQLMVLAFKDKILVLLTIAAIVSLVLGVYQATGGEPEIVRDADCPEGCEVPSLEWVEGVAIVVAIVIIVLVGSLTDWQKERQFQRLNAQREDRTVKVIRDGQEKVINTKELVVGDIALVEPGEIIPVDGVFLSGHNVRVDESGATGESDAIKKVTYEECIAERDAVGPGGKRKLDCFMVSGGKVLEGVGEYVVISAGTNSFHGRIMMSMQGEAEATPLQIKLNGLAELIVKVGIWAGGLLFVALMIRYFVALKTNPNRTPGQKGQDFIQQLIIAVVLIVAAVPEGLPLAVTLALAFATNRMTKQNLLVRVLGSCETMANATVVCTDKTGTLTQNVMTVVAGSLGVKGKFVRELSANTSRTNANEVEGDHVREDFSFDMSEFSQHASPELQTIMNEAICINSTAFEDKNEAGELEFVGSKTETALLRFAKDLNWPDYRKTRESYPIVQMIPFSSELKAMGVVIKQGDKYRLYTKGASEILTKQCTRHVAVDDKQAGADLGLLDFNDNTRNNISRTIIFYANQSLRTLALCYRDFESWPPKGANADQEGNVPFSFLAKDLNLIAVTGIEDPLRPGVREAVQQCHRAGVGIKMCTGDNVLTARSIANQCGIFTPGGIVMEGPVFRKLSDADRHEIVPRLQILARSSPEDKKLLVQTLKDQGEVVGVTGDGTNDGPALKLANVGFAMGITGTEVAKTASDIILMDDSFASIVVAIKTGRCVNDSVRKFVQFQLSVNVAAIILTFVSAIESSASNSILSAVQLLWVNLIMDTFAALALATDPPTDSSLDRKPSRKSEPLINVEMAKMILITALYQCIVCFVLHFGGYHILKTDPNSSAAQAELRTLVFNVFVFCQIFNQINCRRLDRKLNVFEGFFRNYWFMGIFFIMCAGQVIIVEVGGAAFQVTRIGGRDWGISIIIGLISFPIGVLIRLLPSEPFYRFLIKCHIYPDPSRLPDISEEAAQEVYEYNPALEQVKDSLSLYANIRGRRLRSSPMVLKSRSARLREANIQLPSLLTMVPTVIAGTVGAGAHWINSAGAGPNGIGGQPLSPRTLSNPAGQDPSRSTAELFAGKVQLHPETDPSDPMYKKFGLDPAENKRQQKA